MANNKTIALILFLIFALIGGFYLTINKVSNLQQAVTALENDIETLSKENTVSEATVTLGEEKESSTSSKEKASQTQKGGALIPTAILFKVQSSPLLTPQSEVTVATEKVIKEKDTGMVKINIKAYTNKADSYSALEPGNFFEIMKPSGQNQKPLKVKGKFNSIPPQSAVTGKVVFKVPPEKESIILLIESKDGKKYYKFNFEKGTYQETALG